MRLIRTADGFLYIDEQGREISLPDIDDIEDLKAIDSDFIEGKKYILFKNLGVCIGGMTGKKIPEGKLLIAFDKNHLDFFENFVEV